MNFDKISRRSFIKKTTALTVSVSAMTLFSGLVSGADEDGYYEWQCSDKRYWTKYQSRLRGSDYVTRFYCYYTFTCVDPNGNELGEFRTKIFSCGPIDNLNLECFGDSVKEGVDLDIPICN